MRYYVADMNGVLSDLKTRLITKLSPPREADVWVFWQDVLGSFKDLLKSAQDLGVSKPTYTVQHGRAATLDYDKPNAFPLISNKYLCWGSADKERMTRLGYGDRTEIVGCPLNSLIKPKVAHKEKVVLFVPVNTGKEEPENIAAYYELLKLRYHKAQQTVLQNKDVLKNKWGFGKQIKVSFNDLAQGFDVVAKLLPWHDKSLYHGSTCLGYQDLRKNNELVFNLLQNVDLVVGIDEGCTEIYAYANDVPVIIVDGFKYRQHKPNGRDYEVSDIYRTDAAVHVPLEKLGEAVEYALAHPEHKREERKRVAEAELGISYGDANSNIIKAIKKDMSQIKGGFCDKA
jgi:hypothetical protein